jgi:hypothetical protein
MPPSTPATPEDPAADCIVTEHGALEPAGADAADADAVVFGACIDVLERSPGNCTGISGSTDDGVRAPTADPVDEAPTGSGEDDADAFDVGTFNGSEAQADPARALPADVFDGEQPVPLKPVPPGTERSAAAVGTALANA